MAVGSSEQKPIGRRRSCDCGVCHKCKHREYMREYYRTASIERRRQWVKGRDPVRVQANERKRMRPEENAARESARQRTRRAIAQGTLTKKPCERCGDVRVHAHHEDYSQPFEVAWLCALHHMERHRERVVEQGVR